MKKILILIGLISSMYATPPCELPDQKVCTYFYKGAMSSEIIIVNLLPYKVNIEYASAVLDFKHRNISDLKLDPGGSYTLLKSVYDDPERKAMYNIGSMRYKVIQENNTVQQKQSLSNNEKKQNIKIQTH